LRFGALFGQAGEAGVEGAGGGHPMRLPQSRARRGQVLAGTAFVWAYVQAGASAPCSLPTTTTSSALCSALRLRNNHPPPVEWASGGLMASVESAAPPTLCGVGDVCKRTAMWSHAAPACCRWQ
jgi:hypothetical protein